MRNWLRTDRWLLLGGLIVLAASSPGLAQNVTDYASISEPLLLLLREPAVLEDLRLSPEQQRALRTFNDQVDGPLLALRNWPAEKAREKMTQLVAQTRQQIDTLLNPQQQQRLDQITLRVQGIKLVVTPAVASQLELSAQQQEAIEQTLQNSSEQLRQLLTDHGPGKLSETVESKARALRQQEQQEVLGHLSEQQQKQLRILLGRTFNPSRLGRVSFKAPELIDGDPWLNSPPRRLADLRGQVIVLHFFAFG